LLSRAFIDDPAMAYLFRDAATRASRLDRFFAVMAHIDDDVGHWSMALDPAGVPVAAALWRPPGAWATPFLATLRALPQLVATFGFGLPRALAMQGVLEKYHPHAPHWYLQFVGCEPAAQGKGYGGAAIRARLAMCDAQGLAAALETATPGNLGLYQALGFVITARYAIKDGPDFWTMWREPR
jgi:GNAT superfamily N-acetyltransferase